MLELIDNNIDMLKKANNLGKMLKIDAFIENNGEKWLWRIENWVHSYAISDAGFFYHVNTEKCYFIHQNLVEIVLLPPHYWVWPLCSGLFLAYAKT